MKFFYKRDVTCSGPPPTLLSQTVTLSRTPSPRAWRTLWMAPKQTKLILKNQMKLRTLTLEIWFLADLTVVGGPPSTLCTCFVVKILTRRWLCTFGWTTFCMLAINHKCLNKFYCLYCLYSILWSLSGWCIIICPLVSTVKYFVRSSQTVITCINKRLYNSNSL